MKQEAPGVLASITTVLASLPWWWIIVNVCTLLGLAGSAAATMTTITGWLFWILLCAALLLLGRSFYVIYVKKTASRLTTIMAWFSLTFMACYWSWYLLLGGREFLMELMSWQYNRRTEFIPFLESTPNGMNSVLQQ